MYEMQPVINGSWEGNKYTINVSRKANYTREVSILQN